MAHTLDIPLSEHFNLLRTFSRLEAHKKKWDDEWVVSVGTGTLNAITAITRPLTTNDYKVTTTPPLTALNNNQYDAVAIVDASGTGFGAIVLKGHDITELQCGWEQLMPHSAHAEPKAATEVLRALHEDGARHVALITDHYALALAQRRPFFGNGGFSTAYFLNEFFKEAYKDGAQTQVFYVKGDINPADAPSRAAPLNTGIITRPVTGRSFPALTTFKHPYKAPVTRPWWYS